jgi:hypothetical protein
LDSKQECIPVSFSSKATPSPARHAVFHWKYTGDDEIRGQRLHLSRLAQLHAKYTERPANTGVKYGGPHHTRARNFVAASPRHSISPSPLPYEFPMILAVVLLIAPEEMIPVKREMAHCKMCERWTLVYSLFGVQRKA